MMSSGGGAGGGVGSLVSAGQGMSGGIQQFLSGIFGHGGSQFADAFKAYKPYAQQAAGYQMPFYNNGVNASNNLQNQIGQMSNPTEFINKLMGGYQSSPWAKYATQAAQQGANNSASASGLVGSTPFAQQSADYAKNIASGDMGSWLQNVLGVNQHAMEGNEFMSEQGQHSGDQLSNIFSKMADFAGGTQYGQSAGENTDQNNWMQGLIKMFTGG